MALLKPDANTFARIKVVGIGGGGGNVINSMLSNQSVQGVDFIAINTDAQALLTNHSPIKLQIGEKLTKGLGSGSNPEVGKKAAEESHQQLEEMLADSDMVFLACGMGGGTGTGATPVVADIAKKTGALTVAVVTKPFLFEGTRRMVVADDGIEELRDRVDTLIIIPNQRLLETIDIGMRLEDAFKISDSVLGEGVQGISDLITTPGLINVDFADVRTIMTSSGTALMGIGSATGDDKAAKAAREAITSPLLEISIQGANGILFNISGGKDLTMKDVNDAAEIISKTADGDANIIFGTSIDEALNDQIKITVIATGFEGSDRFPRFSAPAVVRPQNLQEIPSRPSIGSAQGMSDDATLQSDDDDLVEPRQDVEKMTQPLPPQQEAEIDLIDDDPFEIPAFLRQKKQ